MSLRYADLNLDPAAGDRHREGEEGAAPALPDEEISHPRFHSGTSVEDQQQARLPSPVDTAQRGAEQRIELRDAQRLLLRGERALERLALGEHLAVDHVPRVNLYPTTGCKPGG